MQFDTMVKNAIINLDFINNKFNKLVSPPECLSMSTDNYEL